MLLTKKPMLKTAFFSDALFVAEGVVEAEADVATAMSLSKPAQLDLHVATSLAILLTRKKRKKMLLTKKPMLKTAFFSDALFVAEDVVEAEADVATAMSLSKPAQLDRHVVTDLVILLLTKKLTKKKRLLTEKPRLKR